ncbi:MAG TPA: N(4)-(beta-N-acetylglucosaminyl)-L-asparaginase [Acidobacteriota bacterium]|jgi:N4-(beta-N-acetylglucosaminyl)-L-asparaginase|nr:N(4)-(beta-N-acetylglucosaminyl)-L-asparaginase [Acidobacteriota bacterium]HRR25913.1 N(4)-(beta-N-acetylglucosaminyl)-L-asparaginase [Acidobacteriota bacterium]HRR57786.1 N(4)-(beta-N-acetylglucosaminyl)-L-asparaginase [Acidobacteriota bacterium]HRV07435.1 N(4)-(beta-N-acetylglucosaminyl)-L-asparaginase [Acidobacteriota bacterium]
MNRREFVGLSAAVAAGSLGESRGSNARPVVIASANGLRATERAMEMLWAGADPLEAVVEGVNIVELDPNDHSVGFGGLPNEEGVVQLDASVMHGPTRGAGSVAALEKIKTPSRVAKLVMECTDHVLLVGEGALKFALATGFQPENLLTDEAREIWLRWKRDLSPTDNWIDPESRVPSRASAAKRSIYRNLLETHGTINCNAVTSDGDLAGVTTTSGLAFKLPGRVGDSPIIGAGLYVDNDVGACGSTGRGEANLKTCASFLGVELMRQGLSPEEAGLRVLQRIVDNTVEPYLLSRQRRPLFHLSFYLLNKTGRFAGVSLYEGKQYAAHDGRENRLYEAAYLFSKKEKPEELPD